MRSPETISCLKARLGRPYGWIAVTVYGAIFALWQMSTLQRTGLHGPQLLLLACFAPVLASAGYGFLSPLPWQWTGDERPLAGYLRGAGQALLFGVAFFLALTILDRALHLALLAPGRHPRFWRLPWQSNLMQVPLMALLGLFIALGERGDQEKTRAENKLKEAQWILLRAQLSPHVLFNSLNALA